MSISPGQPVSAAVVNEAFLSRKINSSVAGIIQLLNTNPASGPAVSNLQKAINDLLEGIAAVNNAIDDINEEIGELGETIEEIGASVPFSNYTAEDAPTVDDDSTAGYRIGSKW